MTKDELMCLIVLLLLLAIQIREHISLVLANKMLNKAMKNGGGWVIVTEKGKRND